MSGSAFPGLRHRIEFVGYRALAGAVEVLPEGWALHMGSLLGWLAGVVLRIRRSVVDSNLARAFPDRSASWRRRIAVESYRHLGREAVMTLRLGRASVPQVLARTEMPGIDSVHGALALGHGLLAVTGHLGNWEIAGAAAAARGLPVGGVVRRQRNRLFDEELVRSRTRLGIRTIPRSGAPRDVLGSLRNNEAVALVADQDAGGSGIFVEFLGSPASTARGPALFALRTGAPLFGVASVAVPGTPRRYQVHIEELVQERTGGLDEDIRRLTQAHADFLTRWVRRVPEQYFWVHKRWKTQPLEPGTAQP